MVFVKPRTYIYGIIVFTLIISSGVGLLSFFSVADPTFGDADKLEQFNRTFNQLDELTQEIGDLESTISDAETDFGTFGVLNSLISSSWQTLKLLVHSLSFMNTAFDGLTTMFSVPKWVPILIGLLVTTMISFAIYSAIFQREI